MDAFGVYKTYLGIKAHFTNPKYDYTIYGSAKAKHSTFANRNDRYFFEKISKKYNDTEIVNLFVANFLNSDSVWIGDFLTTQMEDAYTEWCRRNESIEYHYEQDVETICNHLENHNKKFDDLFVCEQTHPEIFKMVMRKQITPETYVILDGFLNFNSSFDARLQHDAAYTNMSMRYKKYKAFVDVRSNAKMYRKKLLDKINRYALA